MDNLENQIIGITIGIRFARSFRIPDISGSIIDNILYGDKTPFGVKKFTQVQEDPSGEKVLLNSKTKEYLRLNTDDVILGISITNNFEEKFSWIKTDVLGYFKDELFKTYEINNIKRIGIIFHHKIQKSDKLRGAISLITDDALNTTDNINISFSDKLPAMESFRSGVNDYKNTIYNFEEAEEEIHASLDYQYYYVPAVGDLRECFVDKVFDGARLFLENNYYPWLSKYENNKNKQAK